MENRTDWALLARYVSGECSSDEEETIKEWIRVDPSRKQLVHQLQRIWDAAEEVPIDTPDTEIDVEADWQDVQAIMEAEGPANLGAQQSPDGRSRERSRPSRIGRDRTRLKLFAGAATAIVLLVGALWLLQSSWIFNGTGSSSYRDVVTEPGERARIQLMDGSRVMLNVDSKLRLLNPFGQQRRVVHLTGEAYFEVETDPTRPFVVKTEDAEVEVHGTSFNVRGYPEAEEVHVAVKEGGVSLHPQHSKTTKRGVELRSGEIGLLTRQDAAVVTEKADVGTYIGWTEGRLIFDNTPLPKVAVRLERWYNMDVDIEADSLHTLRLTANLKSESIRNVLDVISTSLGIEYRIRQNAVLLSAQTAPS